MRKECREAVSPGAYADALEIIVELEEAVEVLTARIGGAETEAARYLELATRLEGERNRLNERLHRRSDLGGRLLRASLARKTTLRTAEATIAELRAELLALRHRDLLGRAAGREPVGPLHLERWAEIEAAGWVVREGSVYALTVKGEEVWRG